MRETLFRSPGPSVGWELGLWRGKLLRCRMTRGRDPGTEGTVQITVLPWPPCAHAPARPEIKLGKTSQSQSWCYPSRAYRDTPPESLIPRDEVKHKMVSEYWATGEERRRRPTRLNVSPGQNKSETKELNLATLFKYSFFKNQKNIFLFG